jgi:hypothetical protein
VLGARRSAPAASAALGPLGQKASTEQLELAAKTVEVLSVPSGVLPVIFGLRAVFEDPRDCMREASKDRCASAILAGPARARVPYLPAMPMPHAAR